jgi:PST family polysaccharide transporter
MSQDEPRTLGRRIATSGAYMVTGRLIMRFISIISTLILVRLLVPEDFGIVGLAAAIFTVADVITNTGYGQLLIRRATADRVAYDTAFTLNLLRCAILAGLVALSAPLQAWAFGEPRIGPVLLVVAATVALDGLASIGLARLERELRFDLVFRYQLASRILSFLLTILLAVVLGNYWCLVLGNLFAKLLVIPYSYVLAPHRPRLTLALWREFFHFSKWMFAFNLCSAVDGQAPNVALGAAADVTAVGRFQTAYQIAAVPVTDLAVPLRAPLYAGYAQVKDDAARLSTMYRDTLAVTAAVTVPLSVGIALVAPEVERLALGPNWVGVAALIVLCALFALAEMIGHFAFSVFILRDRLRTLVVTFGGLIALRLPLVTVGVLAGGTEGLLLALIASALFNAVVWQWRAARLLGHRLRDAGAAVLRPALSAAVMTAAVLALRGVLPPDAPGPWDDAWRLPVLAVAGAVTYLTVNLALWRAAGAPPGPERLALGMVVGRWRAWRAA